MPRIHFKSFQTTFWGVTSYLELKGFIFLLINEASGIYYLKVTFINGYKI